MRADPTKSTNPNVYRDAIRKLDSDGLYAQKASAEGTKAHLERSNRDLRHYVKGMPRGSIECELSISENDKVLDTIRQRIEICDAEIERRGSGDIIATIRRQDQEHINEQELKSNQEDINNLERLRTENASVDLRPSEIPLENESKMVMPGSNPEAADDLEEDDDNPEQQ